MVDCGDYLWNCLAYIDLNMVRAGVVEHPRDSAWTAYQELMGERKRYRVIDLPELLEQLGGCSVASFRKNYVDHIDRAIRRKGFARDAKWTEAKPLGLSGGQARYRLLRARWFFASIRETGSVVWIRSGL